MKFSKLILESINDNILEIKLNDPQVHNALSPELISELNICIKDLSKDKKIKIIIFSSTGKSFCSGGDLLWMKKQLTSTKSVRVKEASKLADLLFNIYQCNKPIIGKIEGNAFGGGVGLIAVCDFIFATNKVKMALTEVKLGLIPATISPYVIKKIGEKNSINLFTTARTFNAEYGKKIGLIDYICLSEKINQNVKDFIKAFEKSAPNAIFESKKLVRNLSYKIDKQIIKFTINKLAQIWETDEAKAGINAFFNKSKPYWFEE